ncbi:Uncharacterised protein [Vibrio cholerae]|nr:Uncharacterised protein [Vibrio cholerae]
MVPLIGSCQHAPELSAIWLSFSRNLACPQLPMITPCWSVKIKRLSLCANSW